MIKVIFADINNTLVNTLSGKTFPIGIWDVKPNMSVWEKLREWADIIFPEQAYLFLITNEGGIERGFTSNRAFFSKLDFVTHSLQEFLNYRIIVDFEFYPFNDQNSLYRKPNYGMLRTLINKYFEGRIPLKTNQILMIGDASGKPGQFSNSDKQCAANAGIPYCDVEDFINFKFE